MHECSNGAVDVLVTATLLVKTHGSVGDRGILLSVCYGCAGADLLRIVGILSVGMVATLMFTAQVNKDMLLPDQGPGTLYSSLASGQGW